MSAAAGDVEGRSRLGDGETAGIGAVMSVGDGDTVGANGEAGDGRRSKPVAPCV